MSDPFIGQVAVFGFPFAPRGWAMCHGQVMPLSQNVQLYSIIGNSYGGDGKSTFALPDLQGRAAIAAGQGPGLSAYYPGDTGGAATITLKEGELAIHRHPFLAVIDEGTATNPSGNVLARATRRSGADRIYGHFYSPNPQYATTAMAPSAIGMAGGNGPHNNMQPYLALNFCIALQGVMPPR